MMLNDEQRMIRDSLREFMDEEIAPDLPEADRQPLSKDDAISYMQQMAEMDVGPYAEGSYDDPVTSTIVSEEVSRVWPSLQVTMGMSLPVTMFEIFSERTREAYTEEYEDDRLVGCFAITEPEGGSDTKVPNTTAIKDGDEYVITGEKTWVSNAPIADIALVVAWDDENDRRDMFLVDEKTAGFETRELEKLGWKGSPTGQLFFDECRIPVENKLSRAVMEAVSDGRMDPNDSALAGGGPGGNPLNSMFASMRNGMAAISVGIMQAAYEAALEYATDREVFDQPIGQHQLVQEKLYNIRAGLETGRLLTRYTAQKIAAGDPEARMLSSLSKGWVCEKSVEVTDDALQVYGGNGLSTDYPLERYYRDARTMPIPDGTTEIQKLIVGYELTDLQAYT
ncbi:acyl-CoA dehydrogenase family protein [Natrarchaeobaculum aegyptiacum]|uniref:Acyl-CoA dehydrogenase n=1 Tax=Natrarchaeobaculum aegyptiacum TaxID=745377 RepID=A0A2Z2HX87_9EURY|nr:acyl-CoA dehydrogenase family protein [Natrarchaeobaculum aegyptiacum]ARS90267.1 acyl-CoA dehydrogenase [Natrarchaeobaculum aegyptiacum]